ncbi:MAG TPA: iron ABC transporter permease [Candidatus Acidoferrum sp.]|nr:iron ABC transporter permease [Candidatus Acidoferrum sp.]
MKYAWLILILLPILALVELASGPAHINVMHAIADLVQNRDSVERIIVLEVRLPRTLLAILCGAALAISGAALQGLLRNPLASPDLLGISQTSALMAVIALYFGFSLQAWFVLPLAALGGATLAVLVLLRLTRDLNGTEGLILAGIALTALAGSLTTFTLTFAPNPYALQDAYFWLLGSIGNRSGDDVWLALPFMLAGTALLLSCSRCLDALSLGEDTASALGFPLPRYRWRLIVGVACNIGAAVAVSGSIGFVGLMVPHILRSLCTAEPSRVLRWSIPGGAVLVLLADVIVQHLPANEELPLGVLTALLGGPFFLLLLLRHRSRA